MQKNNRSQKTIPKLSSAFEGYIDENIGWYIITTNTDLPIYFDAFLKKIKNQIGNEIYSVSKNIGGVEYNIIYIGILKSSYRTNANGDMLNHVFFITTMGVQLNNKDLSRNFAKIFSRICGSEVSLNRADIKNYEIKSYIFQNMNLKKKKGIKDEIFLYFKSNINFSSEIRNTNIIKRQFCPNLFEFIVWNTNNNCEINKEEILKLEMNKYLESMKHMSKQLNKLPDKWYIKFILLFQKYGADFYSKNKKNMFRKQGKGEAFKFCDKEISEDRINELSCDSFKNLIKKSTGFNNSIEFYFSNDIIEKNKKTTHIFIDGSSIGDKNAIIVMTIKKTKGEYQCLYFIQYKKLVKIIETHSVGCSRLGEKKSVLCKCEWLLILDFICSEFKHIKSITIDFEPGLISAAGHKGLQIWGCYFHYQQNLFRKINAKKISKLLVSICEKLPFTKNPLFYIHDLIKNNKHIYDDTEIINYVHKIFSTKINKFNYQIKNRESYFKLTNNCCERFFQYLKESMKKKYSFQEVIIVRVYLDTIGYYKIGNSKLANQYDSATNILGLCINSYLNGNETKFALSEKKPKKDKHFNKLSKKKKISNLKKINIIKSELESVAESFDENDFSVKNFTKSLNFLGNSGKNKIKHVNFIRTYSSNNDTKNIDQIKEKNKLIAEMAQIIQDKDKIIKEMKKKYEGKGKLTREYEKKSNSNLKIKDA